MEILYISFGWFLGVITNIIAFFIKNKIEACNFYNALRSELNDLKIRLAFLALSLYNETSEDFNKWFLEIIGNFDGDLIEENEKVIINEMTSKTIKEFNASKKGISENIGKQLKKYNLTYLILNLDKLRLLSFKKQGKLLNIHNNLIFFNEDIDLAMKYFIMIFDSSISEQNRKIIDHNLSNLYLSLAKRAKYIANKIYKLDN